MVSYSMDSVRSAWDFQYNEARRAARANAMSTDDAIPYTYVKEIWNDSIVVSVSGISGERNGFARVPYTVAEKGDVTFGKPEAVKKTYVALSATSTLLWREGPSERLVRLAGSQQVDGYTRKSSTGKTVHVDAYTRSVSKMSVPELQAESKELSASGSVGDLSSAQKANRKVQVDNELRKRQSNLPVSQSAATQKLIDQSNSKMPVSQSAATQKLIDQSKPAPKAEPAKVDKKALEAANEMMRRHYREMTKEQSKFLDQALDAIKAGDSKKAKSATSDLAFLLKDEYNPGMKELLKQMVGKGESDSVGAAKAAGDKLVSHYGGDMTPMQKNLATRARNAWYSKKPDEAKQYAEELTQSMKNVNGTLQELLKQLKG